MGEGRCERGVGKRWGGMQERWRDGSGHDGWFVVARQSDGVVAWRIDMRFCSRLSKLSKLG